VPAPDKCTDCLLCTRECPMSLEVHETVKRADMEDAECILCATCVDWCPQKAIQLKWSGG
jgi:ferredoxin-type protein NapH